MYAPSARNAQPWQFIVIDDKQCFEAIMAFHPYANMLKSTPCAILVCADITASNTPEYCPIDCANATQNILLAAHGLKLGAVWIGIYPREERIKAMRTLCKLPDRIQPFSLVAIGHPAESPKVLERFKEEKIHLNQWNDRT